nr:unnamed protein product [Spirometra erinaceieuropaei]
MEDALTTTAPQVVQASMDKLGDVLSKKLSLDDIPVPEDWVGWLSYMCLKWAVFAAEDPWGFVGYVMMIVGPLFLPNDERSDYTPRSTSLPAYEKTLFGYV